MPDWKLVIPVFSLIRFFRDKMKAPGEPAKKITMLEALKPDNLKTPDFDKPKRRVDKVFIHCSASDRSQDDDISVIREWHTTPSSTDPSKPWSDVGYHYFIKKNGTIQLGRPLSIAPAAQAGHNTGTIAICLHGLLKENFTEKQFDSLRRLCRRINGAYDGKLTFHGHCEVNKHKTCPVFDYRAVLGLSPSGKML